MKKRISAIILCAALCGCNFTPAQTEAVVSETTSAAAASMTTASITATGETETTVTETTETEPAVTTVSTEEIPDISSLSKNEKTVKYLSAMLENEVFSKKVNYFAEAQIVDMDSDGLPELIAPERASYSVAFVFYIDENGNAVYASHAENSYDFENNYYDCSYFGGTLTPYKKDGKNVFFTESYVGGASSGESGVLELSFADGKIFTRQICGYYTMSAMIAAESGYDNVHKYRFGDREKLTEEEYNSALEEYFAGYEQSDIFSRCIAHVDMCWVTVPEKLSRLAEALDAFFEAADNTEHEYSSERQKAYAEYLDEYTKEWEPYGVFIDDINGDGGIEMVIATNPFYLGVLLYYNSEGLQVLELGSVSDRGHVCYDKETGMIDNLVDYGHTQGTFGYLDERIYRWDGSDYVPDPWFLREGGYYTLENGEIKSEEYGQAYINGEPVSDEAFELKLYGYRELKDDRFAEFPLVLNAEKSIFGTFGAPENASTDYDAYIKEKLYTGE